MNLGEATGAEQPRRMAFGQGDSEAAPQLSAAGMAKYDPLEAFLKRRGSVELELEFAEIERIIGSALPASAGRARWWAGAASEANRHEQPTAWNRAGYDAFLLPGSRVLFRAREP